jgi:coenzyme F420-0:L-glutamate ligase/coenzyme F420-1:gamma-L-glutamate ligase
MTSTLRPPAIPDRLQIIALPLADEVYPGTDLAALVLAALERRAERLQAGDVVVVAQKVVSKAEGRLVRLAEVVPSAFAQRIAAVYRKDPRLVELVLRESRRIVRMDRGILITETHHGFVCANAGVDLSNVSGGDVASLLPLDPDRSAETLRTALAARTNVWPAVIVSDTFGRPWRTGLTNVALGVAGMAPIRSHAGQLDPYGYPLRVTALAVADELAGAAELVMGKTEWRPFALVRGYPVEAAQGSGRELLRDPADDLFR